MIDIPENKDYVPEEPKKKVNTCYDCLVKAASYLSRQDVRKIEIWQGYHDKEYPDSFDPSTGTVKIYVIDDDLHFINTEDFEEKHYHVYWINNLYIPSHWIISKDKVAGLKQVGERW